MPVFTLIVKGFASQNPVSRYEYPALDGLCPYPIILMGVGKAHLTGWNLVTGHWDLINLFRVITPKGVRNGKEKEEQKRNY